VDIVKKIIGSRVYPALLNNRYLMTLIQMNHVLLKTLETYSQEKSYMGIKKRRAIKKKKPGKLK